MFFKKHNLYIVYDAINNLFISNDKNNNFFINNKKIITENKKKLYTNCIILEDNTLFIPLYLRKKWLIQNDMFLNRNPETLIKNENLKKYDYYFIDIKLDVPILKITKTIEIYILLFHAYFIKNPYILIYVFEYMKKINFKELDKDFVFSWYHFINIANIQDQKMYRFDEYYKEIYNGILLEQEWIIKNFESSNNKIRNYQINFLKKLIWNKKKKISYFLQVGFGKSWIITPLYILNKLLKNESIIISVPTHMIENTEKIIMETCLIYKNDFYYYNHKNIINFFNKPQIHWIILLDHNEIKFHLYQNYNVFIKMKNKINILMDEIDYFFDPYWLVLKYNTWTNKKEINNLIDIFYYTFNKYLFKNLNRISSGNILIEHFDWKVNN